MRRLSRDERRWLREQIDLTLRTPPEERLRFLHSLQRLFLIAAQQNGAPRDPRELESWLASRAKP